MGALERLRDQLEEKSLQMLELRSGHMSALAALHRELAARDEAIQKLQRLSSNSSNGGGTPPGGIPDIPRVAAGLLAELQDEVAQLRNELAREGRAAADRNSEMQDLRGAVDTMRERARGLHDQLASLVARYQHVAAARDAAEGKLAELQATAAASESTRRSLLDATSREADMACMLEAQASTNDALNHRLLEAHEIIHLLKARHFQLTDAAAAASDHAHSLESRLQEDAGAVAEARQCAARLHSSEAECVSLRREVATLRERNAERAQLVEGLQTDLMAAQGALDARAQWGSAGGGGAGALLSMTQQREGEPESRMPSTAPQSQQRRQQQQQREQFSALRQQCDSLREALTQSSNRVEGLLQEQADLLRVNEQLCTRLGEASPQAVLSSQRPRRTSAVPSAAVADDDEVIIPALWRDIQTSEAALSAATRLLRAVEAMSSRSPWLEELTHTLAVEERFGPQAAAELVAGYPSLRQSSWLDAAALAGQLDAATSSVEALRLRAMDHQSAAALTSQCVHQ